LDGFAICPYLQRYIDHIDVRAGFDGVPQGIQDVIDHRYEAIVFYGSNCEQEFETNETDDVEILHMQAGSTEPPLWEIDDYTLHTHDLVIVQRRSTLESARKRLQNTAYYQHWREVDNNE
jgi:hypothetical protein